MKLTKIFNLNAWDIFLIGGFTAISVILELTGNREGQFPILGFIAGLFSILCSIYGAKGNIVNFFFGFIGSLLTAYIAYKQQLWSNCAIYLLFNAPIQIVGLIQWKKRLKNNTPSISPRWMSWKQRSTTALATIVVIAAVAAVLAIINKDPQPVMDSTTTVLVIVAQIMLSFAFIDLWIVWIICNACNIIMWGIASRTGDSDAILTMVRSCFFMLNTIYGIINWIRLEKSGIKENTIDESIIEKYPENDIESDVLP